MTWADALPNLLIGLREGLEAGLVVSILLAALRKTAPAGEKVSTAPVWLGIVGAVALAGSFAAVLTFSTGALSSRGQEAVGGSLSVLAVVLVTAMVFWMRKTAASLSGTIRSQVADARLVGAGALAVTAFLAVGREGLETTLFMWTAVKATGQTVSPLVGAGLGLLIAVVLCRLLFQRAIKLNLGVFFSRTALLLIVIAAGVLSYGLGDLQDAGLLSGHSWVAFDVSGTIATDSWWVTLITGVTELAPRMTVLQIVAWAVYLAVVVTLFIRAARTPAKPAAAPPAPASAGAAPAPAGAARAEEARSAASAARVSAASAGDSGQGVSAAVPAPAPAASASHEVAAGGSARAESAESAEAAAKPAASAVSAAQAAQADDASPGVAAARAAGAGAGGAGGEAAAPAGATAPATPGAGGAAGGAAPAPAAVAAPAAPEAPAGMRWGWLARRSPWTVGAVLVLVPAAVAAGVIVALPASRSAASATMTVTATSCAGDWTAAHAGAQTFTVVNRSGKAGEINLDNAAGAIVGEIETLGPATSAQMTATLTPGTYTVKCLMSGDRTTASGPVTVSAQGSSDGSAAASGPAAVKPVSVADLQPAAARYRAYVAPQLSVLAGQVATLRADLKAKNLAKARTDWVPAQLTWDRIGAAYGSFGDLGDAIDGLPQGLPEGVADPGFTGLHRIEYGLWHGQSAAVLSPFASRLATDVAALRTQLPKVTVDPTDMPTRAHEILEDALRDRLTNMADEGSGTQYQQTEADIQGTRVVLDELSSLIAPRAPKLLPQIDAQLTRLDDALLATRVDGKWRALQSVPREQQERVESALGAALESLDQIPTLLEVPIQR